MKFVNFNSFQFMFDEFKTPLKITIPANNSNERNELGLPVKNKAIVKHVTEPLINNQNPNLTYTNTEGGQQSEVSAIWESKAIKDAPRNTIVMDSQHHRFETVSSTQVRNTDLWYYQLKETGDRS